MLAPSARYDAEARQQVCRSDQVGTLEGSSHSEDGWLNTGVNAKGTRWECAIAGEWVSVTADIQYIKTASYITQTSVVAHVIASVICSHALLRIVTCHPRRGACTSSCLQLVVLCFSN